MVISVTEATISFIVNGHTSHVENNDLNPLGAGRVELEGVILVT